MKSISAVLLLASTQAVNLDRVSNESQQIISNAVNDVLRISSSPEPFDPIVTHHHHVHHAPVQQVHHHHHGPVAVEHRVVPVTKYVPVPGPVQTVEKVVYVPQ